jgi:cation transport ATPase
MGTDESDEQADNIEFEKKMEALERDIKREQKIGKAEIMTVKMDKAAKLKFSGILYITMIIFEWILFYVMALVFVFPFDYIMTPAGGYHLAGACFLILSFIFNLRFQISKTNENGKLSFFLGLIGAIFLLMSTFMSYTIPGMYSIFPTTVLIITIVLILLGCFQFAQIINKKS